MKPNAIELLAKLVSINSVFPNEKEIGEFLFQHLQKLGFKVRKQVFSTNPERFNVLAEKGEGKSLLLYGHMDTVPIYSGWTTNPLALKEEGDKLIGRGTLDMKAGCAAFLSAIEEFEPKGYKLKIAFGADEENISEGAHALAKDEFMKDVIAVFVSEPAVNNQEHHGPRTLVLGRRGRCDIIVTVKGESAHGALGAGINAIEEASKIILALKDLQLAEHEIGKATMFCRKIYSESGSLSVPDNCEFLIDRHLVPPETPDSAVAQINELIAQMKKEGILQGNATADLKQRKTPFLKPYATPKEHPFTKFVDACVKEKFGKTYYSYGLSVADDNIFGADLNLPVITIGPKGEGCHAAGECVLKSSYLELIETYKMLLSRFQTNI